MLEQFIKQCCPRQHVTPEEWGVLQDCLTLTHGGERPFTCSGRDIAHRFGNTGKDAAYRIVSLLVGKGWLVKVGGGGFNPKTGRKAPTLYRIPNHNEWAKSHKCQSGNPDIACLETQTKPVSESRHTPLVKPLCIKPLVETLGIPQPSKSSFYQQQEIKGEAHGVSPPCLDSQTGGKPDYAMHDGRGWVSRPGTGARKAVEVAYIKNLNALKVKP